MTRRTAEAMSEEKRNVNPNLLKNNIYGVEKVDIEEGKKGFFPG